MASLTQQLFRKKPVPEMSEETGADTGSSELARTIGFFQFSMFGVGATIGTGIFFVLSAAVPVAGPAVICVVRDRRHRSPGSRRSATPSWPAPYRCRGRRTPMRTRRSAS